MEQSSDIFDIYNPNLPEKLIDNISSKEDREDRRIIALFELAKRPLNVKEVVVGYYNKHNELREKQYVLRKLYRLAKKGILGSTGRKGEYKLITSKGGEK